MLCLNALPDVDWDALSKVVECELVIFATWFGAWTSIFIEWANFLLENGTGWLKPSITTKMENKASRKCIKEIEKQEIKIILLLFVMAYVNEGGRKLRDKMGGKLNETASAPVSSFAEKMLKKMGWKKGEGLGKDKQGISTHIKASKRKDEEGLGAEKIQAAEFGDTWWNGALEKTMYKMKMKKKLEKKMKKEEKKKKKKRDAEAMEEGGDGGSSKEEANTPEKGEKSEKKKKKKKSKKE
mmetsp:Transcript_23310/g.48494  ORF Transcript_23310/g.48494 Transcript_23310/m.48494 type:complete len:240 (+) Transcript_23310:476-1195(+)